MPGWSPLNEAGLTDDMALTLTQTLALTFLCGMLLLIYSRRYM